MWFSEKPFLKFERLLETYVAHSPNGFIFPSMPIWLKTFQKTILKNNSKIFDNFDEKILYRTSFKSRCECILSANFKNFILADGVGSGQLRLP